MLLRFFFETREDLLAFIGESEIEDPAALPKSRPSPLTESDAELQAFLRAARDEMARARSTRLVDLRLI